MGDKQNNSFWSPKAREKRGRREEEEKSKEEEEKKEGGGEEEDQGMFVLESSVLWIPKVLVWRIVALLV